MKKILFLAPRLPLPADTGGKIRTLHILRQLRHGAQVHLVCFSFEENDSEMAKELEKEGISVTLVPKKKGGWGVLFQALFRQMPVSVAKYHSLKMRKHIQYLIRQESFDAVHVDHVHMAQYRHCFNGALSVLDGHNVEHKILERCARVEPSGIKRFLLTHQAGTMKNFESRRLGEFSMCWAVSEDDQKSLLKLGMKRTAVHLVPNGVDTEYFQPRAQSPKLRESSRQSSVVSRQFDESLIFTGSMDWWPNRDGVLYFCKEILPLIWKVKPRLTFYVVGKSPSSSLLALAAQDSRIMVTGKVEDVRPFLAKSQIFVCPIRVGGGTRLKILEAMAMAKPVVSTSLGAEGIGYTSDKDIVLADSAEEFADEVVSLLETSEKRHSLGIEARKLVCQQYDWKTIGRKIHSLYEELHVQQS